jgi:type IV pilus assembly protein PilM
MSLKLLGGKPYVGIDLGHHTIKVAQVEKGPHGWRVARSATCPTPEDAIKDGVVVDTRAVSDALKTLLRDAHISASSGSIAVSGASVIVRVVRIPKMAEATLRKSIKFEASRYVPSSVEESYVEFEIIGEAEENQMEVLVVAAPKDVVESRIKACESAGIEIEAVDVEAFAAYRSLIEAKTEPMLADSTVALLDIGASTSNMSVVKGGVFAMTRSIPNGGNTLTDALKNYFKLSDEDAETGKSMLNATELLQDTPSENPPLRVIQPHLDDLVREIRRSMNYYQSQQQEKSQDNPITMLLLAGGGAKLPGLNEYISEKLGLQTLSPEVLSDAHNPEGPADGLEFAVASGLAMRPHLKAA